MYVLFCLFAYHSWITRWICLGCGETSLYPAASVIPIKYYTVLGSPSNTPGILETFHLTPRCVYGGVTRLCGGWLASCSRACRSNPIESDLCDSHRRDAGLPHRARGKSKSGTSSSTVSGGMVHSGRSLISRNQLCPFLRGDFRLAAVVCALPAAPAIGIAAIHGTT